MTTRTRHDGTVITRDRDRIYVSIPGATLAQMLRNYLLEDAEEVLDGEERINDAAITIDGRLFARVEGIRTPGDSDKEVFRRESGVAGV